MIGTRIQAFFALFLLAAAMQVGAQESYPSRPIRLILPSPAGAITDIVARAMGQELTVRMGQPWVIDNRPGGNQLIGTDACAKSPPNGYTLCFISIDTHSLNPILLSKLPYDAEKDFKPVTNLFFITQGVLASVSLPANSIRELQALAAGKPGSLNFGTLGPGTNPDVFRRWLAERWKTDIVGVPYKGGVLVTNALVAREVHLSWIGVGNVRGQIKGAKIKILALGASRRSRQLPEIPTMEEAGIGGFPQRVWWGLAAPAGTPEDIVSRLNGEVLKLYREPKFSEFLDSQFLESAAGSPEAFAAFIRADRENAATVVKQFNIPRQ